MQPDAVHDCSGFQQQWGMPHLMTPTTCELLCTGSPLGYIAALLLVPAPMRLQAGQPQTISSSLLLDPLLPSPSGTGPSALSHSANALLSMSCWPSSSITAYC